MQKFRPFAFGDGHNIGAEGIRNVGAKGIRVYKGWGRLETASTQTKPACAGSIYIICPSDRNLMERSLLRELFELG